MVRINLINPRNLPDQHLIAEYNEILMFIGYVKKYPRLGKIPEGFRLGKGHILFFKNKLKYIRKRHDLIRTEMKRRGFVTNKKIDISGFNRELCNDWKPKRKDKGVIVRRLIERVKQKPKFYRYYGEYRQIKYLINLIKN
ncbi:pyrimidine dimer DNA glycosylase/endonuclease V [Nanoarchaeota archaeon]